MLFTVGLNAAPACLLLLSYSKRVRILEQTDDVNNPILRLCVGQRQTEGKEGESMK